MSENLNSVFFRAKYKGKIEYGYFAAKIIPPVRFPSDTFNLEAGDNIELEDKEGYIIIRKV